MTPEQAKELGDKLISLAAATRLGVKLDYQQFHAVMISELILHVLNKHGAITETSYKTDRNEHRDHNGDIFSTTVTATHCTFTITL